MSATSSYLLVLKNDEITKHLNETTYINDHFKVFKYHLATKNPKKFPIEFYLIVV